MLSWNDMASGRRLTRQGRATDEPRAPGELRRGGDSWWRHAQSLDITKLRRLPAMIPHTLAVMSGQCTRLTSPTRRNQFTAMLISVTIS